MIWSLFSCFSWFASLVIMIRAPHFWPLYAPSLPSPHLFLPVLFSKLSAFLAKVVVLWSAQLRQKGGGVKMVGNTSKMMFRALKIDWGMAKKHPPKFPLTWHISSKKTQKFEEIFNYFSSFRLLQTGLCNVAFLHQSPHKRWGFITHKEEVGWLPLYG